MEMMEMMEEVGILGATGWNASATVWDAHAGNFDQNRGRQHGGTSQIDEDSLNMSLLNEYGHKK